MSRSTGRANAAQTNISQNESMPQILHVASAITSAAHNAAVASTAAKKRGPGALVRPSGSTTSPPRVLASGAAVRDALPLSTYDADAVMPPIRINSIDPRIDFIDLIADG